MPESEGLTVLRPGIHTPSAYSTHTHNYTLDCIQSVHVQLIMPHSYGRGN